VQEVGQLWQSDSRQELQRELKNHTPPRAQIDQVTLNVSVILVN
jgi:hypothetical protein